MNYNDKRMYQFCGLYLYIIFCVLIETFCLNFCQDANKLPGISETAQILPPSSYHGKIKPFLKEDAISPGDTVAVSVTGAYKGLILEAREVTSKKRIGTWINPHPGFKVYNCPGVDGIISGNVVGYDKSLSRYSNLQFTWRAPAKVSANQVQIYFSATIVTSQSQYYDDVRSGSVIIKQPIFTSPFNLTGCGKTKGCLYFGSKRDCFEDCEYILTYQLSTETAGAVVFEMAGISNGYIALGISSDMKMGDDDIYACILTNPGSVSPVIWRYYTPKKRHASPRQQATNPIDLRPMEYVDGRLICRFVRNQITPTHQNAKHLYLPHHIIFTYGPAIGLELKRHIPENPAITETKIIVTKDYLNTRIHGLGQYISGCALSEISLRLLYVSSVIAFSIII